MPTTYGNLDNLLPCIFLWVRWRVPGLDLIFSKLNHRRVSPTCFTSVFTPNFLSGAIKKKKSISYRKAEETWALYNQFHPLKAQEIWSIQVSCLSSLNPDRGQSANRKYQQQMPRQRRGTTASSSVLPQHLVWWCPYNSGANSKLSFCQNNERKGISTTLQE